MSEGGSGLSHGIRARANTWKIVLRISRRATIRDRWRTLTSLLIVSLPIVLVISSITLWSMMSSSRYLAIQNLGSNDSTQARITRVSFNPIEQDYLGEPAGDVTSASVDSSSVDEFQLNRWLPSDAVMVTTLSFPSVNVSTEDGLRSALVTTATETSSLDIFAEKDEQTPRLENGHAVLALDVATELNVGVGDTIHVSVSSTSMKPSITATVMIDQVADQERSIVVGLGTFASRSPSELQGTSAHYYILSESPVTWDDVQLLNHSGFAVISRAVLAHPPQNAPPPQSTEFSSAQAWLPFIIVIGVLLVFIELILFVSPLFAVAQTNGIPSAITMLAVGATRFHLIRLMMSLGLVLGVLSAFLSLAGVGIVLGTFVQTQGLSLSMIPWEALVFSFISPIVVCLIACYAPSRDLADTDATTLFSGHTRAPSRLVRKIPFYPLLLVLAIPLLMWAAMAGALGILAFGLALLISGIIGTAPYFVAYDWRGRRPPSLGLRLAVRDAVRNGQRTLPAMASLMTTALLATALLITLTSANEAAWNAHAHLGPKGSVFVSDADVTDMVSQARVIHDSAAAAVTDRRSVSSATTLSGLKWESTDCGPSIVIETISPDESSTESMNDHVPSLAELDLAYIVDDGTFLSASNLISGDEMVKAVTTLNSGGAIMPKGSYISESGQATLRALDMSDTVEAATQGSNTVPDPTTVSEAQIQAITWSKLNVIVLSPKAAEVLKVPVLPLGQLLIVDKPVSVWAMSGFISAIESSAPGSSVTVIQPPLSTIIMPYIATLIALLSATGTIALIVVLSANAMRPDFETLEAIGASRTLRSRVTAYQGMGLALVCLPISVLSGLIAGVLTVMTIARSGVFPELANLHPVIPWFQVIVMFFGSPILATVVAGAVAPRQQERGSLIPVN